jgi:hypothetical protein
MKKRKERRMEHIIHIQWEGPLSYRDLPTIKDARKDYGLYQVYACHPVYGSGVLVYIGMAARQTLGKRIEGHRWETGSEPDPEQLDFYVGRLKGDEPTSPESWANEIRLAEKLLIHEHGPAYNSTHMMAIHNESEIENVRVINFGATRSLRREVSGYMSSAAGKLLMKKSVYTREEAIPLPGADT